MLKSTQKIRVFFLKFKVDAYFTVTISTVTIQFFILKITKENAI